MTLRILVVDDDRDFATGMADVVTLSGHTVSMAATSAEALRRLTREPFDLAFLDVKLPDRNGAELFEEAMKIRPNMKAVMMTAYQRDPLVERAMEQGAWAVLHKPLDMGRVLQLIDNVRSQFVVLVADDDEDFRENLCEILEREGYAVRQARDGQEAIDDLLATHVDLLLLDLKLPKLTGLQVVLQVIEAGRRLPIFIVTAYADTETVAIKALRSLDVSGIVRKPVDPDDLLRRIAALLRNKES